MDSPDPATPTTLISVTPEELQRMIDEGVKAAAADPSVQVQGFDYERFGSAIATAITKTGRRKVTIGEYVAKLNAGRPILKRRTFQNGILCQPVQLTPAEITLLNQITHSGKYLDRVVDVVAAFDGSEEILYISYNCATIDQRMENKNLWTSFEDLLRKVVAVQQQEDAEADAAQPSKAVNRKFGHKAPQARAQAASSGF